MQPLAYVTKDEPAEVYHQRRIDEANAGGLKKILRSPAHFKHWINEGEADNPTFAFGRAFHVAVLEPETFDRCYRVLPKDAPRRPTSLQINAKKPSPETQACVAWWAMWNADGRASLDASDYDRILRMADSVRAHPTAAGLLVGGDREVTFRWQDEETGIACKARADLYLAGEYLMDLKTCTDASAEGFARAVASYHYDLQQAHYLDGIRTCGDSIRYFVFLACEKEAPYVCQPHVLAASAEQRGFALRTRAINRQAECLRTGKWPGYSDDLIETTLPAWAHYGIEA